MGAVCPVCGEQDAVETVAARFSLGDQYAAQFAPLPEPKAHVGCWRLPAVLCLVVGLAGLSYTAWQLSTLRRAFPWVIQVFGEEVQLSMRILSGFCLSPVVVAAIVGALLLLHAHRSRKRLEAERLVWLAAIKRWGQLYYCARDDLVIDALASAQIEPRELHNYLYGVGLAESGEKLIDETQRCRGRQEADGARCTSTILVHEGYCRWHSDQAGNRRSRFNLWWKWTWNRYLPLALAVALVIAFFSVAEAYMALTGQPGLGLLRGPDPALAPSSAAHSPAPSPADLPQWCTIRFGGAFETVACVKLFDSPLPFTFSDLPCLPRGSEVRVVAQTAGLLGPYYQVTAVRYNLGPVVITRVADGSPAQKAGLQPGDAIVRIDGMPVETLTTMQAYIGENAGRAVRMEIERQGQAAGVEVVPRRVPPEGQGPVGFSAEGGRVEAPAAGRYLSSLAVDCSDREPAREAP